MIKFPITKESIVSELEKKSRAKFLLKNDKKDVREILSLVKNDKKSAANDLAISLDTFVRERLSIEFWAYVREFRARDYFWNKAYHHDSIKNIPAIIGPIYKAFARKHDENWNSIYWCIDLHDTIITGTYSKNNKGYKFYPKAIEVLKLLSRSDEHKLILWTSSYRKQMQGVIDALAKQNVIFDDLNDNSFEKSTSLCDFSRKFYFNILIDDKTGFDPNEDWGTILEFLES